jgi:hypothetical protein
MIAPSSAASTAPTNMPSHGVSPAEVASIVAV